MPKQLQRDLGLFATVTVSVGAMIGSGIFVLPGLAVDIAGPGAVLAYLLAGLLVVPAALAKSEMATAMPEAGGTYLYIDRAMGPLPGTIAGLGAWFSLVFKSAFALVGLGAYLLLFAPVPEDWLTPVALALAGGVVAVNVAGVKQTGRVQAGIVVAVVLALVGFVADGLTFVETARYHPFFPASAGGVVVATGFVFVSYAGVTKIASVAEEIEDPGRNIPLGILGSVALMMFVYTFVVFVVVGLTPVEELTTTLTPMAAAAGGLFGGTGAVAMAVVAVFALVSMANAGVLAASRYPLAMSRDALAPATFGEVSARFRTPVNAIAFTGAVLLLLVAFVPVVSLAKLASAFQILVFTVVNAALVAFREADLDWYDPEFVAPGYPWVQVAGALGGLALLPFLGLVPLAGAVGIVVAGAGWYELYGRDRTSREGAALDALRRTTGDLSVERVRAKLAEPGGGGVVVALSPDTSAAREAVLLRVAADLVRRRGGAIKAVQFESVPDQTTLSSAAERRRTVDHAFEARTAELVRSLDVPVDVVEVVGHDVGHAVLNYARGAGADVVLGEWESHSHHGELLGRDVDWYMERADNDLVFVCPRTLDDVDEIGVAAENHARLRFLYAVDEDASADEMAAVHAYHDRLSGVCTVPVASEVLRAEDRLDALHGAASGADLAVVSTSPRSRLYDVLFGSLGNRLAQRLPETTLLVHSRPTRTHTFLRRLLERYVF